MGLSINDLNRGNLGILARSNLDNEIVAVEHDIKGDTRLITISKKDVTCWQLFLRLFNSGKLMNKDVHLRSVCNYLNRYNWSAQASSDPRSLEHGAYLRVCTLANKCLRAKWDETLVNNVATATYKKDVEFVQYQGSQRLNRHCASQTIQWNEAMQVGDLQALLRKQFPDSKICVENQSYGVLSANTSLSPKILQEAKISVTQQIPEPVEIHHHHHHSSKRA